MGYTAALGIPSLRARIARHYGEAHGIAMDPERIVIHPRLLRRVRAGLPRFVQPGERVAIAAPGYPPYRACPVRPRLRAGAHRDAGGGSLRPDAGKPHRRPSAKATGGRACGEPGQSHGHHDGPCRADRVHACARDLGIAFISDEIYHGLDYAFPAVSAAEIAEDAVVINSFSKYFCMTGWRVGWMVVPPALVRTVERLQQNLSISVPTLSQIAAEAAFDGREEMDAVKHGYEENRRILVEGLPKAGIDRFLRWMAPSISMRTCLASPTIRRPSPRACWTVPTWRRHRAWTSTRSGQAVPALLLRPFRRRHARGGGADRRLPEAVRLRLRGKSVPSRHSGAVPAP